MQLHEFMACHREEILEVCRARLHNADADHSIEQDVALFFDEVLRAIRRDSGHPATFSPLPGHSETAARLGAEQQRAGLEVTRIPAIFGAISNAIGFVGDRYGLSITAEEYRIFNACIDAGVATSIEKFSSRDKEQEQMRVTQHFGYLAHELRNALGNAALAFKLMRSGGVASTGRTGDILGRNLTRMEMLVAQTLGSVQMDAGVAPDLRALQVAAVLRNLEASAIPERAISIGLEVDDSVYVVADEMLLTSAISNLLHNALKFSRSGSKVTLRSRADAQGVLIAVDDECGGLVAGDALDLFLPFVKGQGNPRNTGLGLAITKRAVEVMGGSLKVSNRAGFGCSFAVLLPRAA
jgi:signal transduction histidine kinase